MPLVYAIGGARMAWSLYVDTHIHTYKLPHRLRNCPWLQRGRESLEACVFIHTYKHTYIQIEALVRDYKRHENCVKLVCSYTHTYINTYIHTYWQIEALVSDYKGDENCVKLVCSYTHTYINTYIHTYKHTYIHTDWGTCQWLQGGRKLREACMQFGFGRVRT